MDTSKHMVLVLCEPGPPTPLQRKILYAALSMDFDNNHVLYSSIYSYSIARKLWALFYNFL